MILAADGLPLLEGETVWSRGGGKFIVLEAKNPDKIRLKFADSEHGGAIFPAYLLLHIDPLGARKIKLSDEEIVQLKKLLKFERKEDE